MTNFDFLLSDPQFEPFANAAVAAEMLFAEDLSACVLGCRQAMTDAALYMYAVDGGLKEPWRKELGSLISRDTFRRMAGDDLIRRMQLIVRLSGNIERGRKKIAADQAEFCLENLYLFLKFVAHCYGEETQKLAFDRALVHSHAKGEKRPDVPELDFDALKKEKQLGREAAAARRKARQSSFVCRPLDPTEAETRKLYIDTMLEEAGWIEGQTWQNEVVLPGMPNPAKEGRADYVLYDDMHVPLAVVEAKKTSVSVEVGRQQAKLYADLLEKQSGRRPVIFMTNGFDTRIKEDGYNERKVSGIYSKRDLEKHFNLRKNRRSMKRAQINMDIAGRYYQEGAIRAACQGFEEKNRRKALLVMATGSGKTRTVIALCDLLIQHGWVRNILFLADRRTLVKQAKKNFKKFLPDLAVTNLCESKPDMQARCVLSTYQTMMSCIDSVKDEQGKVFTCGHFDLLICDEAHRSIYNKYKDIFTYFDAFLIGLTATPKNEIDKNTYETFELEKEVPTYGYDLSQAVKDGYLVPYVSIETSLKFIEEGITYADLTEEEKEEYENKFVEEDGEIPDRIEAAALNEWVFNEDTIRKALDILMTQGIKVEYGEKIGKTIIFAKNHHHAEKIKAVFDKEYPHLVDYAQVIDNRINYVDDLIDDFSKPNEMPQIAISVDMLDTGVDVPEVLNLVFFKKVYSKAKFWQMIGRGTRLCPGLLDGKDKEKFYIFDFCNNFAFFRMNDGKPAPLQMSLQSALFHLKTQIIYKLQDLDYQTEELIPFRASLVEELLEKVRELNRENFAVRQHLRYVEKYSSPDSYNALTYEDTLILDQEIVPLVQTDEDDPKALRFDALMYGIERAYLVGKTYKKARKDLLKKVRAIAEVANIPAINAQKEFIHQVLHTDYVEQAGVNEFEEIRKRLRDLIKYIPVSHATYETAFSDEVLETEWHEAELENDDLNTYKEKAEFYVRQHQDEAVIAKLHTNVPLSSQDVQQLERILWSEIGSREDYEAEYGKKPLGEFVREIVGLDMAAAKAAFAQYLNEEALDSRQIYFVNQIVEYIVQNGMMKDMTVLQGAPFTDRGSVIDVFTDLSVWAGIRSVIEHINANAAA